MATTVVSQVRQAPSCVLLIRRDDTRQAVLAAEDALGAAPAVPAPPPACSSLFVSVLVISYSRRFSSHNMYFGIYQVPD